MKLPSIYALFSSPLLFSSVFARYGLSPDSIPMLTRTVDYTFRTICHDFHNPSPMFDERELTNTILAFSSDLYTFLLGYSVGDDNIADRGQGNTESNDREHPLRPIPAETKKRGIDLLEDLIDETINSNRRSDMLESQTPIVDGPIGPTLWREEEPTTHRYAEDGFACSKFQKDIRDFSESFINMTYAISEKCYRQCTPGGYYGSVSYAIDRLQTAYERHYAGSFYAQIREIEAETGCYFDDIFMVDTERAVDYAKVWVDTFQRHQSPCEGLGLG